jgi:phage terminase large subunit-like protein
MTEKPSSLPKLRQLEADLEFLRTKRLFSALKLYEPYEKQMEFHALGISKRERLLMAGNQLGKTLAGSCEIAMHLTGKYPKWWVGRRFTRPTKWWAGSKTGELTRNGVQKYLFGEPGVSAAFGTGAIPKEDILETTLARGISDFYDTVQVQHYDASGKKDGISIVRLKSYDQGREKWQAETLDGVWFDEEPPLDIYSEGLTRVTSTRGMTFVTFTPLKGMSDVVKRFLNEPSPDRAVVTMTIEDAKHIPPEERQRVIDGYPAHEREARARGTPVQGEGRIFVTPEEALKTPAVQPLPRHWVYIWGLDFAPAGGTNHPFAAVLLGWDRDADVLTIVHTLRMKALYGQSITPLQHAAAMKPLGQIPVAWPQDGTARESSGETLASQYKKHGLLMLSEHATFPDGGLSTEAGITEMDERMTTGRWKVFSHCEEWFSEYRMYHREDGLIVKVDDDLLSASRIAMMMRRYARPLPDYDFRRQSNAQQRMASNVDFAVI